jgi:hypothetical protein
MTRWYGKVRSGGWIGGHDWAHPTFTKFGVDKAVLQFMKENDIKTEVYLRADRTWFFQKPSQ